MLFWGDYTDLYLVKETWNNSTAPISGTLTWSAGSVQLWALHKKHQLTEETADWNRDVCLENMSCEKGLKELGFD